MKTSNVSRRANEMNAVLESARHGNVIQIAESGGKLRKKREERRRKRFARICCNLLIPLVGAGSGKIW